MQSGAPQIVASACLSGQFTGGDYLQLYPIPALQRIGAETEEVGLAIIKAIVTEQGVEALPLLAEGRGRERLVAMQQGLTGSGTDEGVCHRRKVQEGNAVQTKQLSRMYPVAHFGLAWIVLVGIDIILDIALEITVVVEHVTRHLGTQRGVDTADKFWGDREGVEYPLAETFLLADKTVVKPQSEGERETIFGTS